MQLNPQLANLPVYQPGRPLEEVARELGLPLGGLIKLASNENPLGPSKKVTEKIRNDMFQTFEHCSTEMKCYHVFLNQ